MAPLASLRPRVSRETRLLLTTVLLSVVGLWVLARVRFPDRPAAPSPVPPVLAQLAPRASFDDLADVISDVETEVSPTLVPLGVRQAGPSGRLTDRFVAALRFRDDAAVALIGDAPDTQIEGGTIVARDLASGLAVVRVPASRSPPLRIWTSRPTPAPRYMVVTDVSRASVSVRPVFVGSLHVTDSPFWTSPIWALPPHADIPSGAFVHATTGALAGLVVEEADVRAIVRAGDVLARAEWLLREQPQSGGWLGVNVQSLTPAIAATGAPSGIVITWVDPTGPAADLLVATDIIEALGDEPLVSLDHWRARTYLAPGETVALRVRRSGDVRDVQLTAASPPPPPERSDTPQLGLRMRWRSRLGSEVTRVDPGSIAADAGIEVGDVITRVGEFTAPTPEEVNRALTAPTNGSAVLAAIMRGSDHSVVPLMKP